MEYSKKIIIIKLSALGDVLRSTCLLHGLKREFLKSSIVWVSAKEALPLLENNQYIDENVQYRQDAIELLKKKKFDILINLDKEKGSTRLAMDLKADIKIGFGSDAQRPLFPFNKESEYAYKLGISDDLKFKLNKKTYQQIIYEMCSLDYKKDKYILNLRKEEKGIAEARFEMLGVERKRFIVGLNTGAGSRFANKAWEMDNCIELVRLVLDKTEAAILLLGGKKEESVNKHIRALFKKRVYNSGCDNTLREFCAIINRCNMLISGDTLAMHIGIALNKYVLALFGPTCHQEIDLYNKGSKIIPDIECAPCYKNKCEREGSCMSAISSDVVFKKVEEIAENGKRH